MKNEKNEKNENNENNENEEGKNSQHPQDQNHLEDLDLDKRIFEKTDAPDPEDIGFSPGVGKINPDLPIRDQDSPYSFENLEEEVGEMEAPPRIKKVVRVRTERGGTIRSMAVGICVAVVILLLGLLSGVWIVNVANDVFAFTYETDEAGEAIQYTFDIDEDNLSTAQLAALLKKEGVIRYAFVFRLYCQVKGYTQFSSEDHTLLPGSLTISGSANYDAILKALYPASVRQEVSITFTEGMTTDDVIDLLVEKGVGDREKFIDAIQNYDFDYWFLEDLTDLSEDRYYRLDGYLYPDTYRFYTDSNEVTALNKLLSNFNKKFGEEYKTACENLGMTVDQVVTLASLIQSEAGHSSDYTQVSAVFHNRLKSTTFNGRLDSDATIQYYFRHVEGARHKTVTPEDLTVDTPYNTYLYNGLTPGPICNPSINALKAALYPEENCNYYYFVSRPTGYMYYATTYAQHLANIEKVKEEEEDSSSVGEWED
jgi:UPF0755 protein